MRVTPVDLRDFDVTVSDLVRSPGLHASDIYNDLYKDLEPERYSGDRKDLAMYATLGTAWEERLQYLLVKSGLEVIRPGELRAKGGNWVLSPDGVMCNGHTSITEYKLTWKSSRGVPRKKGEAFGPKFEKYLLQMQDGCNAIESCHARLYTCFVNGNYKPPKPELLAWDIEFSARELKEAFDVMCNHAQSKRMF